MRKLELNLDQLRVESFAMSPGQPGGADALHPMFAKATYGCTEGWAGCAAPTINAETCQATICSDTMLGFSCDYFSCANFVC